MYAAVAFDTHNYIKEIVKSGITEPQAEAIAKFVSDSRNYDLSRLATKEQVENLKSETKADIENLRIETKADIENLRIETKADIENLRIETKADINRLEQKIEHIEEKMATKEDLARLEVQLAKQDSQQKVWMMSIFLSIVASAITLFFKMQ